MRRPVTSAREPEPAAAPRCGPTNTPSRFMTSNREIESCLGAQGAHVWWREAGHAETLRAQVVEPLRQGVARVRLWGLPLVYCLAQRRIVAIGVVTSNTRAKFTEAAAEHRDLAARGRFAR